MRIPNKHTLLAVDPGVGGTGWALFRDGVLKYTGTVIAREHNADWIDRVYSIAERFQATVHSFPGCDAIVMECPSFHGGVGGMVVAASGDLVKLALLTGSLLNVARVLGFTPTLIKPAEWKGQLPKVVAHDRIARILKKDLRDMSEHARDAIGIGLFALGKF